MIWYEEEVKALEEKNSKLNYSPAMLFYGSSTIRLWETLYEDFKPYNPINLGFGGSTLEACVYFFERIMEPFNPKHIVVYAGDNDLGDGKKPDKVFNYFVELCDCIQESFNDVSITYISIKPSIARWKINEAIKYTNQLIHTAIKKHGGRMFYVDIYPKMIDASGMPIARFYDGDGLHLSSEGYIMWKEALLTHFSSNNDTFIIQK